jgi:uncharacterized Zn finger protein (UPF0148 family)
LRLSDAWVRARTGIAADVLQGGFMTDLYTCSCGSQIWQIFDTGVRCTACQTEFVSQHTPVAEFNHTATQQLEEELEEV